jgi:translocation and assembly module TamB
MASPKRILRWMLVVFSIVLILVFLGSAVLNSRAVHQYVLASITAHVQHAVGGRVEIGDFSFHWFPLGVDFDRVAIHGTESDPRTPLLGIDRVAVGLRLGWLGAQKIKLKDVRIDHPVVHLTVDSQRHTNIPERPPRPRGNEPTNIFDLAIGHFVLNKGEIYYNDRYTPLSADVHNLEAQVAFEISTVAYDASFSYRQAHIEFGNLNPFVHDLQARLTTRPSGITLKSLVLRSGSSWFAGQGQMKGYSSPLVEGSYRAAIFLRELARTVKEPSLPEGEFDTEGIVTYRSERGQPLVNRLSVAGTFHSPALAVTLPRARASVRALTGEYHLDQGTLKVRSLRADVLGGHLAGQLSVVHLAENPSARVEASIRDLSLAAAQDATQLQPLSGVRMGGHLDCDLEASWLGRMRDLQVRSDARIAGSMAAEPAPRAGSDVVPLVGTVHLAYDGRRQVLALRNTSLRTSHSSLSLEGDLGDRSKLAVEGRSDDLHELDLLALMFQAGAVPRTRTASHAPQPLGLGGSASLNGTVNGRIQNPEFAGVWSATNFHFRGASLSTVRTNIQLSSSGLALHKGELQSSVQGRANFDVTLGLRNWSFTPQEPIHVRFTADHLSLADVQHIAGLQYPVSGVLSASVTASGSQASPAVQGYVQLTQARAWGQPIQNLTARFQGSGSDIHTTVNLQTPAGSASATLAYYPKEQGYDLEVKFPGIRLAQLQSLQVRHQPITGLLVASATGRGTLKAPHLDATVEVQQLQIGQQKLDGLKAQASIAQQQAAFKIDCNIAGASLKAQGAVNLTGDYEATANMESQVFQLDPLLASFLPQSGNGLHGQAQLRGSLKGPLKNPNRLDAHVEVTSFNLAYQSLQIAATSPIRLDYRDGILILERSELKGTGTDLQLEARMPIKNPESLQGKAMGNVDLHLIQLLNSQWQSSGQINLNIAMQGARPEIRGTVRLSNAALNIPNAPGIEKVSGEFDAAGGRIDVKSLSGQIGGGAFSMRGSASYQPAVQFNLGMTAKGVRLLYPEGVRMLLSGDLNLTGRLDSALLNGQLVVDHLSLTKSFDVGTFTDQFSGPSPPRSGFTQNMKLNVAVSSGHELGLTSSQLSIQGYANLRVQGTAAEPVIIGRTNLTGGELFFRGRRFQVQHGVIQFVNPVQTQPLVNLSLTTVVNQFNLSMNLVGPPDRLRTTYTSDPPLPPVDIINLLITGHTTTAAQTSPTTPQSLLAKQLSGAISSRTQKLTGISSLTIDPQIGGNQGNAASQLAIQQRVTKNLFFTFATDVTTTQGQVIQVEYRITRKYSMSAVRDQTGGYQLEIKAHKVF